MTVTNIINIVVMRKVTTKLAKKAAGNVTFSTRKSKMVDYSRFDDIHTSSDEEEAPSKKQIVDSNANKVLTAEKMAKRSKDGRITFEYEGRKVYEWEQSIDDVNIYIKPPPDVTRQMLVVVMSPGHLLIGLKGTPPFIDEDLGGLIIPGESTWTFTGGEIQIILQKAKKAEAWDCALHGRAGSKIDAHTKEEVKKQLLLQRFQEEVFRIYFILGQCTILIH